MIERVCVFCGSKSGDSPVFLEAATTFGRALAANGLDLVYGGAHHGLMGAVADGVLAGGRKIVGVVPRGLARQEFAHPELTEHHVVDTMYERKALMAQRADAFVALPGGFGTLDELFDMLSGAQLGLHHKPIGLLDVEGYYAPLLEWISQGLRRGFIPAGLKDVLLVSADPAALVTALLTHRPPPPSVQWISR